jgi:hypothetical protein
VAVWREEVLLGVVWLEEGRLVVGLRPEEV